MLTGCTEQQKALLQWVGRVFCWDRKIFMSFGGSLLHYFSDKFHSLGLQHCAVVSGLALGKCSWKFVFEQLWRPSVNVSWLVQSSSESFSVNPVSLWLNETPVYCQRCCWEPVTALCCSVPVEPGCWALVPNYKPHRSKPSLRSSLLIYFT